MGHHLGARLLLRKCSSTNSRIAEDKLLLSRVRSIFSTNSLNVSCLERAIFFRSLQSASSRLTLVWCLPIRTDRLTMVDFIGHPAPKGVQSNDPAPLSQVNSTASY